MRLTIADVARAAGVSPATVDRVLNERAGVHARTRRKVMTAAQGLGYLAPDPGALPAPPPRLAFIVPGGTNTFLNMLSTALSGLAERAGADARIEVHRMDSFHPEALAAGLRDLAQHVEGLALIALDHPAVRTAIREAASRGVRVVTLISDIADVPRDAYVGTDNHAAGRLAGHLLGRFLRRPGPVALFAGSLGYRGHAERANGFRRILAEEFPTLPVVETAEMHDDLDESYRLAARLLRQSPDLAGIYNIGAGNRGIVRALEEAGRARDVVFIAHELTEHTRRYLLAGTLHAVIDQGPVQQAELAVATLLRIVRGEPPRNTLVRAQAIFRENMD